MCTLFLWPYGAVYCYCTLLSPIYLASSAQHTVRLVWHAGYFLWVSAFPLACCPLLLPACCPLRWPQLQRFYWLAPRPGVSSGLPNIRCYSWLTPRMAFLLIHPATTAFPLGSPPTPAFLLACPQHGVPWVCPQHWCCLSGSPPAWRPLRLPQLSVSPGLPPERRHLSVWLATRLQVMWTCILSCLGLVFSCCRLMRAMQWGMYRMTLYPG